MVHCHRCGAKAADDDVFCPECGKKILKEEPKKKKPPAPKPKEEPTVPKPKKKEEPKEEPETPKPKEEPKEKIKGRYLYRGMEEAEPKKPEKKEEPAPPKPKQRHAEPHPQKTIVQQKESGSMKIILGIFIIIVVIILFRSCGSSEPDVPYEPEPWSEPEPEPPSPPPPPPPEPEPEPPSIDKVKECSGVSVKITDACYSCGLVSCGLIVEIENTGSKPIYRFLTEAYNDPKDFDESGVWEPLDVGATNTVSPYASDYARLIKFIPIILVGDEEVECDSKKTSYGNAYGDGFGECYEDWRNY